MGQVQIAKCTIMAKPAKVGDAKLQGLSSRRISQPVTEATPENKKGGM